MGTLCLHTWLPLTFTVSSRPVAVLSGEACLQAKEIPAESAAWAKEFEQAAEHSRNQDYDDIWKHYGEVRLLSRHLQARSVCCVASHTRCHSVLAGCCRNWSPLPPE